MNVKTKSPKPKKAVASRAGRPTGPRDSELETVLTEVTAKPEVEHKEEWASIDCPYCGEGFEVHVNSEQDGQTIWEDCQVCSRTCSVHIQLEDGEFSVEAHRS